MEVIERVTHSGGPKPRHKVFLKEAVWTKAEADALGLVYHHPDDVKEGELLITYDGYVTRCLKKYDYPVNMKNRDTRRNASGRVRCIFGSASVRSRFRLYRYYPADRVPMAKRSRRLKVIAKLYAYYIVSGTKIDWALLGKIYSPSPKNYLYWGKKLTRREGMLDMVRDEVIKMVSKTTWNVQRVSDEYDALVRMCKEKKDTEQFRLALERWTEILEMLPEKRSMNYNLNQQLPAAEMRELPAATPEELEMQKMIEAKIVEERQTEA